MAERARFFLGTFPLAGRSAGLARMAEADGWDGIAFTDSQSLGGDAFAGLALAAQATSRLQLATGATNAATRHPAVVAAAIATIQVESNNRAILGIARGDSALAYLGRPPPPVAEFEASLEMLQRYLRGETVETDGFPSRLVWLDPQRPKVPVDVAATGPRVIALAARVAERITFSVGAEPERLQACIALARQVRAETDLPPLELGAYINAVAHPDIAQARAMVRGRLSVYARFSTMHRSVLEALPAPDREVAERLVSTYDMQSHAASADWHSRVLDDAFVDRFGVVGPPPRVADRLAELAGLGLDHFVIVGHGRDTPPEVLADSSRRFAQEVLPRLR